jgi:uncharacterized protein YijF (DUF1287 family)
VVALAAWVLPRPCSRIACGGLDIVAAARRQVGVTVIYDGSYQPLDYPGGDVPIERGVCTDVVVRALRAARGMDLQKLVHEDMRANAAVYANRRGRGSTAPDASIDHRRVPNLMAYFRHAGLAQPLTHEAADYLPGDLVAWDLGGGVLHIGLVSDRKAVTGVPLVIHNIGAGAREENILFRYAIIGHYRLEAPR